METLGLTIDIINIRQLITCLYYMRMTVFFDFFLLRTSIILRSSLIVSPDLKSIGMGIAVGISLLSCI